MPAETGSSLPKQQAHSCEAWLSHRFLSVETKLTILQLLSIRPGSALGSSTSEATPPCPPQPHGHHRQNTCPLQPHGHHRQNTCPLQPHGHHRQNTRAGRDSRNSLLQPRLVLRGAAVTAPLSSLTASRFPHQCGKVCHVQCLSET